MTPPSCFGELSAIIPSAARFKPGGAWKRVRNALRGNGRRDAGDPGPLSPLRRPQSPARRPAIACSTPGSSGCRSMRSVHGKSRWLPGRNDVTWRGHVPLANGAKPSSNLAAAYPSAVLAARIGACTGSMPTARREGTVSPAGGHAGATEMAIESNGIIVSETGTISPGAADPLYVEIYDGSLREYLGGIVRIG